MIALCLEHHSNAEGGAYSKAQLQDFKTKPNDDQSITKRFPWTAHKCLVNLGGCWTSETGQVRVGDKPVVVIKLSPDGHRCLDLDLVGPDQSPAIRMVENCLELHRDDVHDLECSARGDRFKVWHAPGNIGVECRFARWPPEKLEEYLLRSLGDDRVSARKAQFPNPREDYKRAAQRGRFDFRLCEFPGADYDIRWQAGRIMLDTRDDEIPVIELTRLKLYRESGQTIEFRDGELRGIPGLSVRTSAMNTWNLPG